MRSALLLLAALGALSACAKTSSNPFHHSSAYSAIPYQDGEAPQVLANGELHYN